MEVNWGTVVVCAVAFYVIEQWAARRAEPHGPGLMACVISLMIGLVLLGWWIVEAVS